jgi:hypothetical protein
VCETEEGKSNMKMLAKLAVGAAMIGGLAMGTTAPADAGVVVRVGTGYHHGCYHCGYHHYYRPVVRVGVGPGYWWHGRRWYHRRYWHGGWRYY